MRITCPSCRYSRDVALEKIPRQAELATCPKCGKRFLFRDAASPADLAWPEDPSPYSEETPGDAAAHTGDIPDPVPGEGVEPMAVPEPPEPDVIEPEVVEAQPAAAEAGRESALKESPAQGAQAPVQDAQPEQEPAQAQATEVSGSEPEAAEAQAPPQAAGSTPAPERAAAPGAAQDGDMWRRLEDLDFSRRRGPAPRVKPGPAPAPGETFGRPRMAAQPQERGHGGNMRSRAAPAREGAESDPPWEQLGRYGFFPGLFATMFQAMFRPKALFTGLSLRLSATRPMAFHILMCLFEAMALTLWGTFMETLQLEARGDIPFTFPLNSPWSLGWDLLLLVIFAPLLAMARLFAWSFLHHLFLKIFQAAPRGFAATLRAVAYSKSAAVCSAIPLLGPLLGLAWTLLITISGCRNAHGVSYARTLCALGSLYVIVLAIAVLVAYSVYA